MRKYLLVFFIFLSGCSVLKNKVVENIKVKEIKSVKINSLPIPSISSKLEMSFTLGIENANPIDISIKESEFEIYMKNVKLGKGVNNKEQILKKKSVSDVNINLSVNINEIKVMDLITNGEPLEFKIVGNLTALSDDTEFKIPVNILDIKKISL